MLASSSTPEGSCSEALAALCLGSASPSDCWTAILAWLPPTEQLASSACCSSLRAAAANVLVGPARLSGAGLASFARGLEARRCPRLEALVLDADALLDEEGGAKVVASLRASCPVLASLKVRLVNGDVGVLADFCRALGGVRELEFQCCDDDDDGFLGEVYAAHHYAQSHHRFLCGGDSPTTSVDDDDDATMRDAAVCPSSLDAVVCGVLAECPHLESFAFEGVSKWESSEGRSLGVGDDCLAWLPVSLKRLRVAACDRLTDAGLARLGRRASLERLDVSLCTGLSAKGVAAVLGSPGSVEACALKGLFEPLASEAVLRLVQGPRLTSLSLTTLSVMSSSDDDDADDDTREGGSFFHLDAALSDLARHCPNLTRLDVLGGSESAAGLAAVARHCPRLEILRLGAHCADDRALSDLVARLPRLRHVDADPRAFTDRSIAALARHCPRLDTLTVRNLTPGHVTDESLRLLATSRLRRLTLCPVHCESTAARDAAVLALVASPWLLHLDVGTTTPFDLFFCAANNVQYFDLPEDPLQRHHLRRQLRRASSYGSSSTTRAPASSSSASSSSSSSSKRKLPS